MKDIKDIAAEYAAKGLAVIPLKPGTKEPLSKGWQEKAARDPETARKIFRGRAKADCNIGAITGAAFGLVVLDLDKHSGKADGEAALNGYLETRGETLTETWEARTGSGGRHIYYATETPIKKRVNILPGVDVCGDGCFVVLSPSVHPNGKRYQWIKGESPDDLPLASLPKCLSELLSGKAGNIEDIESVEKIVEGGRNDAVFKKAASLRGQGYTKAEIFAALKAFNADRCKPPLSEKEVKTICESAGKYARGKKKNVPPLDYHSARGLQEKDLPPLKWVLVDMIPQGLTILASPPKYGKSWWVLDLCLSVAAGKRFMELETVKNGCLYLALEDSENRLQGRINKLTYGDPAPVAFDYAITAANLDEGLTDQLEAYLQEKPETGLVVIDTLQKIRGATKSNESAYACDYRQMSALKSFADKNGISLVVVHHLKKGKSEDPYERISGTNGIFGSADAAIVMQREKRSDKETTFHMTGRDVSPDDFLMEFEPESCRWKCKGSVEEIEERRLAEEYERDPVVRTIKHLLQESQIWTGTASDLFQAVLDFTGEPIDIEIRSFGKKIRAIANMMWARDEIYYSYANGGRKGRKHTFKKYGKPKK